MKLILFLLLSSFCCAEEGPLKLTPIFPNITFDKPVTDIKIGYDINRWGDWGNKDLTILIKLNSKTFNLTKQSTSTVGTSSGVVDIKQLNLKEDFSVKVILKYGSSNINSKTVNYTYNKIQFRSSYDSKGNILVKGKKFFPIGLYMAGFDDETNLKRISEAGFNFLISYQWGSWGFDGKKFVEPDIYEFLDRAKSNNLNVALNIVDTFKWSTSYYCNYADPGQCSGNETEHQFADYFVNEVANKHGNVIMLYMNDEQNKPEQLLYSYLHLKEKFPHILIWQTMLLDPTPTILYNSNFLKPFVRSSDVLAVDPYPIGFAKQHIAIVDAEAAALRDASFRTKPYMLVNQLHGGQNYFGCCADPTPMEQRNMVFQSLVNRAKGVILYSHFDLWHSKPDKKNDQNLFDSRWVSVKRIGEDLRFLSPVLLNGVEKIQNSNVAIKYRVLEHDSKLYIFIVNVLNIQQELSLPLFGYNSILINKLDSGAVSFSEEKLKISTGNLANGFLVLTKGN